MDLVRADHLLKDLARKQLLVVPDADKAEAEAALQMCRTRVLMKLQVCTATLRRNASAQPELQQPGKLDSGLLAPAPEDEELQQLQAEVGSLSERVLSYRATVPSFLSDQLQGQLSLCRPADDDGDSAAEPIAASSIELARDAADSSSMDMRLPALLSNAAVDETHQKMPAIRAKLEEALQRMDRVMAAFTQASQLPSPKTAERVLLRRASSSRAGMSPAFRQALESGQISTRRRIARDLGTVPYNPAFAV